MVLVDTSVWIAAFRAEGLIETLVDPADIVTCLPVIQEVLQGIRSQAHHRAARQTFLAMPLLEERLGTEHFIEAAELFRRARAGGYTVRSSFDCLIAVCALRHDALLLHADRDFDAIARIAPLRSRNVSAKVN